MTLPTSQTTVVTAWGDALIGIVGSALLGFEARVGLVDDVDPALAAHELAVAVTRLERLERASDLHGPNLQSGRNAGRLANKSARIYGPRLGESTEGDGPWRCTRLTSPRVSSRFGRSPRPGSPAPDRCE